MFNDVGQGRCPARDACRPCLLVRPEEHSLFRFIFDHGTRDETTPSGRQLCSHQK